MCGKPSSPLPLKVLCAAGTRVRGGCGREQSPCVAGRSCCCSCAASDPSALVSPSSPMGTARAEAVVVQHPHPQPAVSGACRGFGQASTACPPWVIQPCRHPRLCDGPQQCHCLKSAWLPVSSSQLLQLRFHLQYLSKTWDVFRFMCFYLGRPQGKW